MSQISREELRRITDNFMDSKDHFLDTINTNKLGVDDLVDLYTDWTGISLTRDLDRYSLLLDLAANDLIVQMLKELKLEIKEYDNLPEELKSLAYSSARIRVAEKVKDSFDSLREREVQTSMRKQRDLDLGRGNN